MKTRTYRILVLPLAVKSVVMQGLSGRACHTLHRDVLSDCGTGCQPMALERQSVCGVPLVRRRLFPNMSTAETRQSTQPGSGKVGKWHKEGLMTGQKSRTLFSAHSS